MPNPRALDRFAVATTLLTLAGLALRLWRLGEMSLFADEAYYLLWAQRLAPAYFDHPAGIAFLIHLSTALGGGNELGVRWLNALLSAACVPLSYVMGSRYVNKRGGLIAAAVVAVGPLYVITGRVAYPDGLQHFLLLLNLLALAPAARDKNSLWRWAWFGFTLALLLNVKLSSAFYVGGLALFVLWRRRDLVRQGGFWLAVGIALLGVIPLLGWNLAHQWAGVRWAFYQGQGFGFRPAGLLTRLTHAGGYLTPPAVLLAGLAAFAYGRRFLRFWKPPAKRNHHLLALAAGCLLAPVLFSAADNPRNLGIGLLLLWPLTGLSFIGRPKPVRTAFLALLLAWLAAFSVGSTAALLGPTALPHPQAATAIRADAAGWPAFGRDFTPPRGSLLYAVDYSIAGQVSYYAGRPVFSSGGQFRIWGIPDADDLTVLSQGYLPPEEITKRLHTDFAQVEGPRTWRYEDGEVAKTVFIWRAQGRTVPMARVVADLDYMALARATGSSLLR
ncbi:MAG: ArnT family glycosyltransferase [Anaerolineae bacterium]